MKQHEKRGAPRVPFVSEVVCEGAGTRIIARTSDLSASGVFIHSKLCYEAGSILRLKFSITSTQIETVGEVCYSIPHIGMGIRFLDLKPEYDDAIERLIQSQRDQVECEKVKTQGRHTIPSGVEAVDKLLGGLERGHLYLAHGDASGKSLFGIEFLIEGLKRGQPGVLITSYSREDAVRRFARLGYDCLEDIRSGALLLFKYSYDIVDQARQLHHLEPLLRELGPTLDESPPERIVFDSVNNLLACAKQDDVSARADELAAWARSFGATVVFVANGESRGVIESLMRSVRESFRFDVKKISDRLVRFIAFEKSGIPAQVIRVDPSRTISLLEHRRANEPSNEECGVTPETPTGPEAGRSNEKEEEPVSDARKLDNAKKVASEEARDAFFAMLDELKSFASAPDPDVSERENASLMP
ncbi:MAG TPA: ATPase domain-containing protein [Blastocatellia bacterium]|nr:ATPase domain-containing protein [Blastocatellia bacterium]